MADQRVSDWMAKMRARVAAMDAAQVERWQQLHKASKRAKTRQNEPAGWFISQPVNQLPKRVFYHGA